MSETYEKFSAIREGYRNDAEEIWFKAIPNLEPRQAFCRGFDAGYSHSQAAATHAGAAAEPVAEVVSFANGSYSRNYKMQWLKDVPEGTKLYAAPVAALTSAPAEPGVPDGVWEALQRMIEDGLVKGPASQEDARTVMRYRDRVRFLATPAETPPAAGAIDAREQVHTELIAFVEKIANGEVHDRMFSSLEDEASSLWFKARALWALAAKS